MRALLLAVALSVALASPAAADPTTSLLARLDSCDPRTVAESGPRLDVLLALADGRSAVELAGILGQRRACIGYVSWYGEGSDEIVLVGGLGPIGAKGAMLWVDRGYWRIATVPLGYRPGAKAPVIRPDGREYLIGVVSGGSAGWIGLAAVTVSGASARTTLLFAPPGELRESRLLPDGRLYVEGRLTGDPGLRWSSHPDWPYGAQWLFERRGGSWVQVAQRQAIHPHYLLTGLIGGLFDRDVSVMSRFAPPDVVAQALTLPPPKRPFVDLHGSYEARLASNEITRTELASWDELPADARLPAPTAPLSRVITFRDAWDAPPTSIEVRFVRDAEGWRIASIGELQARPTPANELVP